MHEGCEKIVIISINVSAGFERISELNGVEDLIAAETQRLNDSRVCFAAVAELFQRQTIVVILIHLIKDFIDSLLWRVFIFRDWLLTLRKILLNKNLFLLKTTITSGTNKNFFVTYSVFHDKFLVQLL